MSKIFGHAPKDSTAAAATPAAATATNPEAAASSVPIPVVAAGGAPIAAAAAAPTAAPAAVDVTAILDDLAYKSPEKLAWRTSIVDLLKLVGMDSSLSARKELATDLKYSGDQSDSATMNIWLHKQVLKKLSENGGKVPQELLS